ncbi:MAG: efflux RND transporter periplasmic adaptor subunit [Alistipes sp.]|nr:efflux RND transporter periplasmic adaptor subunit [Alistipes sp.]
MKFRFVKSLLLVGAIFGAACSGEKKEAKQVNEEQQQELPKVTVTEVSRQMVTQQTSFTGTVEAEVVNNISPQQPRRINQLLVDVGDHVTKGQTLVKLDESALVQAKAQLDNYKMEYDRAKELYEFGGASRSEYDARKMAYEVAQTTYDNLLENTTLTSPVAGVVSARNYDNGDMTGGLPVFVVMQIKPVKIFINVSESLYSTVKKGMPVYVTLDSYGDEVFEGKIVRIYPTIDNATRTFRAEVSLPNNDERIRPGMFARVTLPHGEAEHVVVPDVAVQKLTGSGDRYVWIYNDGDGTVSYSKIEVGRRLDNRFEILSGVEDGAKVVITGQNTLTNGAKVELN